LKMLSSTLRCGRVVSRNMSSAAAPVTMGASDNVSKLGASDVALKMVAAPITVAGTMSGVGVVTAVGAKVNGLSVDDMVISKAGLGAFREVVKTPSSSVLKVPSGVPPEYASLLAAPCTAAQLLARVQPGQVVVQSGACSAVGQALVQIAKAKGIVTVSVVDVSSDESTMVDLLKSLGGDVVVPPRYAAGPLFKQLIADLPPPSLAIHFASGLENPALLPFPSGGMSKLRGLVESASPNDLFKLKIANVLNSIAKISVSHGPLASAAGNGVSDDWHADEGIVIEVCDMLANKQLDLWVENFPVEDLGFASAAAAAPFPGFRLPLLKFAPGSCDPVQYKAAKTAKKMAEFTPLPKVQPQGEYIIPPVNPQG